jgi:hypothetical protein
MVSAEPVFKRPADPKVVVPVLTAAGIDTASGVPWLAMELLHGRDLAALITMYAGFYAIWIALP